MPQSTALPSHRVLVIGIGNEFRSDDGVGRYVARQLAIEFPKGLDVVERDGEAASLIDDWSGRETVYVVDAMKSGQTPGTVLRFEAVESPLPSCEFESASSHAFGLCQAVELSRSLGRLPERLVIFGIEGNRFDPGIELSPQIRTAADSLVGSMREEIRCVMYKEPNLLTGDPVRRLSDSTQKEYTLNAS